MRHKHIVSTVAESIAEADDSRADDLGYALYEHVETEALMRLAASDHTDWRLTFTVPDHTVEVRGSGQVLVDGTVMNEPERTSKQA
jgi:hypothetical protein